MTNRKVDNILLEVEDLKTHFHYKDFGVVKAVDGVSFSVQNGQTIGLVGESGCGKSVTALSILRLLPEPPAQTTGQIVLAQESTRTIISDLQRNSLEIRSIRGRDIAMIFQEPMTSLNPVYSIGDQITEAIHLHENIGKKQGREKSIDLLASVGIDRPAERVNNYPHQLSGGMRQRALIAMAISSNPKLLIADEPTTALDVTIQAQILELLEKIQQDRGMSIIMITHDLGIISSMCQEVAVMYLGKIVELSSTLEIFENPLHPYTQGLLQSIPILHKKQDKRKRIQSIPGVVPEPYDAPIGCSFEPRCSRAKSVCKKKPELRETGSGHLVSCWLYQ